MTRSFVLLVAAGLAACTSTSRSPSASATAAAAVEPDRAGVAALADRVLTLFVSGPPDSFDAVMPDEEARTLVRETEAARVSRTPGFYRIASISGDRAVLVLAGHVAFGNSGDETSTARAFSNYYEAVPGPAGWRITRRLPLDSSNRIFSHELKVHVDPESGLAVIDRMQIAAGTDGFAARLNHRAAVEEVKFDGTPVSWGAGGGLLWAAVPRTSRGSLEVRYTLPVEPKGAPNSGRFGEDSGHVRNQYFWHPFFDFNSTADRATFDLTLTIPADYHVATGIPQTSTVSGEMRTLRARTERPTFALTLMYDAEWVPQSHTAGSSTLELFTTPDFQPARESVTAQFEKTMALLTDRFGEPASRYFSVVQGRSRGGNGWHFRSNDMIVTGVNGGAMTTGAARPRGYFGHEVAHAWTSPTGAASNFLGEGWATFAEALVIGSELSSEDAAQFWENLRSEYVTNFEGVATIVRDPENGGVAYNKGAWIFRMLEHWIGRDAFDRGMRAYMNIPAGSPAGAEEWIAAMSKAAGRDLAPLIRPWLERMDTPVIRSRTEGRRVILAQESEPFILPVEIDVTTVAGTERRSITLTKKETVVEAAGVVQRVVIDPEHRILMARTLGDTVRLEHPAGTETAAAVGGTFTTEPVAARREGDRWVAEIPLTAGRYAVWWMLGEGGAQERRIIQVAPKSELARNEAYPRVRGAGQG